MLGPGTGVKTICLESRRSWVRTPLWPSSFKTRSLVNIQYCGQPLWPRTCSASDRQGSNFKSCVWRTVSSHSSHHPQEVLLAQYSLYVNKCGLKTHSLHFVLKVKYVLNHWTMIYVTCHSKTSSMSENIENEWRLKSQRSGFKCTKLFKYISII